MQYGNVNGIFDMLFNFNAQTSRGMSCMSSQQLTLTWGEGFVTVTVVIIDNFVSLLVQLIIIIKFGDVNFMSFRLTAEG